VRIKGGGLTIYRPIHKWTVDEVFAIHKKHGIEPNPLYKLGMGRVGCMPCVNCSKGELLEISKRFPEHIDRIEAWEKLVGQISKRQSATFFEIDGDNETAYERGNIRKKIEWSQTLRGGKKIDLFAIFEEPAACSSAYGLCE
jgi:3'-phosphoadenosine 5'-phosphosulfate sulfotransferase (PAPS reductase)/FAD synthetase